MPAAHPDDASARITGGTAADIAESIRFLRDRRTLEPGDVLPSVRALAEELGVNRNTVVAAYGQLARAGIVESQGRAGTRIAGIDPVRICVGYDCEGTRYDDFPASARILRNLTPIYEDHPGWTEPIGQARTLAT